MPVATFTAVSHKRFLVRWLLPVVAVMIFVAMVAVGEKQVRQSPKWPPPSQHELGGWEVEDPTVLNWAVSINLPATVPILWMWAHNDAFAYAFDDHDLIVYLPWIFLVCCLWYAGACRLDHFLVGQAWKSPIQRNIALCAQALVTLELLYAASAMRPTVAHSGRSAVVCFWAWLLLVALGWVDFIVKKGTAERLSSAH
jgi:hypothetical protein